VETNAVYPRYQFFELGYKVTTTQPLLVV